MTILDKIIAKKTERLVLQKEKLSLSEIKKAAVTVPTRDFKTAIRRGDGDPIRLIAEIKHSSPSEGVIRPNFDLEDIARTYQRCGVNAVSILTEQDFFKGSLSYIETAKKYLTCPVLRKDFIVDEYQIYEARAFQADAVLLIAAALTKDQAHVLVNVAAECSLDILFEVHNRKELDMAMWLDCDIIGINNRDLTSMTINVNTTLTLIKDIPRDKIIVSESGIKTADEVETLQSAGIDALLIGTSLMKSNDIAGRIDLLFRR